jgi:hypothetical protein
MPTATATRERLTSATVILHHPLLNDHKSHYRYLAEHHPKLKLGELTADHVRQYVQHMLTEQALYTGHPTLQDHNTAKGLSPATVNIRTRTLKCFLRFLHDEGYLQTDLASHVQTAKGQGRHDGAFEKKQVLQLLAAPVCGRTEARRTIPFNNHLSRLSNWAGSVVLATVFSEFLFASCLQRSPKRTATGLLLITCHNPQTHAHAALPLLLFPHCHRSRRETERQVAVYRF